MVQQQIDNSNENGITPYREPGVPAVVGVGQPMTIDEFKARQELVKYVVKEMRNGVHYGVIPGTKDRMLWEAGAEYLRFVFRIAWDYQILDQTEDSATPYYYYRVRAWAKAPDGSVGAAWEASCSSAEAKFGKMAPADLQNNVRDRAIKRAFVNLIRNVTGTSGYFKEALDADAGQQRQQATTQTQGLVKS